MLWHQCCVCKLPAAPFGHNRYEITHGFHRECYINHYRDIDPDMVTPEELALLDACQSWVEGDDNTELKVAPIKE